MDRLYRLYRRLRNNKGSALVTVFMVLIALIALGMGVMALSLSNAKQHVVADAYEKTYYPAEGASKQGIEYIKRIVLSTYNDIETDLQATGAMDTTSNTATAFFGEIDSFIASEPFSPKAPDTSAGAAVQSLKSTISSQYIDSDTRKYTVISTAATEGDAISREVTASITVKFVKLKKTFSPFGTSALIVGDTLDMSEAKNKTYLKSPDGVEVDATKIIGADHMDASTVVVAPPPNRNLDWDMSYSDFTGFINDITVNTHEPFVVPNGSLAGKTVLQDITTDKMEVVGPANTPWELHNVNVTSSGYGKIVSSSHLSIYDGVYNNVTIVTKGDLYLDGCFIYDAAIFCGGTLYIRDGNAKTTKLSDAIVYANNVRIGGTGNGKYEFVTGLLYSASDIKILGNKEADELSNYVGQFVAKGDTILTEEIPNKNALFDYDDDVLQNLPANLFYLGANHPFLDTLREHGGGNLYVVVIAPSENIFLDPSLGES